MTWRWRCCFVLATVVATPSCEHDGRDDHGAGTGRDTEAGADASVHRSHAPAKPDESGSGPAVITCGASTCYPTPMFAACCVDAARGTCGVENETVGVACGVPAIADPDCPPVSIVFGDTSISAQGCCTPRGMCGGFNLGSPCALVPMPEDDAGSAQALRTCRPSD